MSESVLRKTLALDIYGDLLSAQKKKILRLHYDEDMGITEIARKFRISRQAVFDAIHSSEARLRYFEKKLGMVRRFMDIRKIKKEIRNSLGKIGLDTLEAGAKDIERIYQQLDRLVPPAVESEHGIK